MVDLAAAYAACARDSGSHYENFPVASWLLPRPMRPHVAAVYAFARAADDFADEGERSVEERYRLLDLWRCRLRAAASGKPADAPGAPGPGEPATTEAIFVALGATIRDLRLPVGLFEDLLSAFRQDVTVARYETWPDLLDYCRRSANPVGRLVLRIAGQHTPQLDVRSDAICTALQLTNFWQDVESDSRRGRVYLPLEELRAHQAAESTVFEGRLSDEWKQALAAAVRRTRDLFAVGRPLCDQVTGRMRYELRATWLGGTRILDRLESTGFDVFRDRPTIGARDLPALVGGMLAWPLRAAKPTQTS